MLSGKDKALLMKLFYKNKESATVALRKFRLQKNVKTGQGPLTVAGLTKLVQRFEETGSLENRVSSGLPSLRQTRSVIVAAEMEALASESAAGTSSARKLADAWAYHHLRYGTFFMEFLISIHTNYSLAMNFYHRIP